MKTHIKTLLLISISLLLLTSGNSNQVTVNNSTFKDGEAVGYDVYYNWGFIWIHAGNAKFSVREMTYKQKPAYLFHVAGNSLNTFDKFYHVRDTLFSIADKKTLLPMYYKRVTREDSYWAEDEYYFTETGKKTTLITDCKRRKGRRNIDTLSFDKTVTDLITVFYRIRNIDYNKMKINEKHPFSIVYDDDDKEFNLYFKYVGKEEVELKNGKKYRCLKIQPLLIKGQVFKDEDGMTIYLSDDKNRIPIYIESKIRVGSIKVMLNLAHNTLYPIDSEVKE